MRTYQIADFTVPQTTESNGKKAKREISSWTLLETEKTMEHESNSNTNCNQCTRFSHQRIGKGVGGLGNKTTSGGHLDYYSIIKIC